MDLLSRLLQLYPVDVDLELACKLGAPWSLENAQAGAGSAPYHIITSGNVWLHTPATRALLLEEGDIVVLPSGMAHTLFADGDSGGTSIQVTYSDALPVVANSGQGAQNEMLCGHFSFEPAVAGTLMASLPQVLHVRHAHRSDLDEMALLIQLLRKEAQATRLGSSVIVRQLASVLFALILRAWTEQAPAQAGMLSLLADARLRRGLQAMIDDPARPWSVDELAEACHMSRASFARHFGKAAGMTPGDMLMRIRMARAAQLLRGDGRNVAIIANAVGYQSEAAFNRAFSRFYGSTPGIWRKAAPADNSFSLLAGSPGPP